MKFPGEASERIARVLQEGPATVAELADRLGLTTAGVRRPLNQLAELGWVLASERAPYGPAPTRGRGRPSAVYSLTETGRAQLTTDYDALALDALRFVERTMGAEGVQAFARERAEKLVAPLRDSGSVDELAQRLSNAGYAATIDSDGGATVQLCQHHCPVVGAAAEFPALCEAETAALGEVLGTHVLRLATLAHGDGVCTCVIPRTDEMQQSDSRKVTA